MSLSVTHYQANFCEENVWHLCRDAVAERLSGLAVFISNAAQEVALFKQKASLTAEMPVVWDYHVVLFLQRQTRWEVWDPDSSLGIPVPLTEYLDATFRDDIEGTYQPLFRLFQADQYLKAFSSDRSHMRDGDRWISPPPPWPCIGEGSTVMSMADIECDDFPAAIDLPALHVRFATDSQ